MRQGRRRNCVHVPFSEVIIRREWVSSVHSRCSSPDDWALRICSCSCAAEALQHLHTGQGRYIGNYQFLSSLLSFFYTVYPPYFSVLIICPRPNALICTRRPFFYHFVLFSAFSIATKEFITGPYGTENWTTAGAGSTFTTTNSPLAYITVPYYSPRSNIPSYSLITKYNTSATCTLNSCTTVGSSPGQSSHFPPAPPLPHPHPHPPRPLSQARL